ncbi:MAG: universal stress protein [Magnetococcales bacterium]|nr:universal stress protein [Magnetococcales bacterium]MBF0150128.1 universal stress protein [Magnetococcales bacterium]MBF0348085.1 universal stress protein [Magnetococcales bacterium]
MKSLRRIIAVIDLFSSGERVGNAASALAEKHRAQLRLVTLHDHLDALDDLPHNLSPEERFSRIETNLLQRLRQYALRLGIRAADCSIITGHPGTQLSQMAGQWNADLILSDPHVARTLHNGWVPWLETITPLPCRLQVVHQESSWLRQRINTLL